MEFRAEDVVGNQDQTPATRSFTVDTVAPDTTIDAGPTGLIAADEATYVFHGTVDDTDKIQCRVDDAAWTDCISPATFADLAEGPHTVAFRAQDAAGNQDQTPVTRSITVDTVAPDTTIDSGPAAGATIATRSTAFAFHGTAGDTARLQCRTDGSAWADCTSPMTLADLADGSHAVEFRAIDAAGNIDASPAARTFLVQVPVVVVPAQPLASTGLVLDAPRKVRAGKKVKLRVQLSGVGTGTVVIRDGRKVVRTVAVKGRATVKLRLKPGKHRLSASYAGSATAKSATSAVRTIVVKRAKKG